LSDRGEFRKEGAGTADAVAGHLCFAAIRVEKPDARIVLLVVGRHHHQESVRSDALMAIQNRCHELGQRVRKAFRSHNNEIVSEAVKLREGDVFCHRRFSLINRKTGEEGICDL